MSFTQSFSFAGDDLDKARVAANMKKAARTFEGGVIVGLDPEVLDPDPDEYVRPGFENASNDQEDEDDQDLTWYVGFPTGKEKPGERYAWAQVHFQFDDLAEPPCCGGFVEGAEIDSRCEDRFFDFLDTLVGLLGGQMNDL